MSNSMKLTLNGIEYAVQLNDNHTVNDLMKMLPLELTLQRYAGHEYYGILSQKPTIRGVVMTSDAHAGGIYYYDGWGAFSVLYGDAHIAPYEVVHIGDVNDNVISQLVGAEATVAAKLEIL